MSDFLKSLQIQGATATPPRRTLADILFRRGRSITMRSRLDGSLIQTIFVARSMASLYHDAHLEEATSLLMELWVSHEGKGRSEGVELGKAVYQTNVGAPSQANPDQDPALDG